MSTVLITVADDALGTPLTARLARLLAERGHRVDRLCDDELARLDEAALGARLAGVACVIHLSEAVPPLTDQDQYAGYRSNVLATRRLLAACRAQAEPQRPRIVLRSAPDAALSQPADSYGRQKAECEALLRASGLEHLIFRIGDAPPEELALAVANALDQRRFDGQTVELGRMRATEASHGTQTWLATQRTRWGLLRRALRSAGAFIGGGNSARTRVRS